MTDPACGLCNDRQKYPDGVVIRGCPVHDKWQPPRIVIHPGRCGGQPTVGEARIPVELVAGVYWQHGMGEAETQWEPHVDRNGVLVACWYAARYGTRTWRKRWAEWLEIADYELWHTDPDRWGKCPDPPTVSDGSQETPPHQRSGANRSLTEVTPTTQNPVPCAPE